MIRITDSQDTLRSESGVLDCSLEVVFMTNHSVLSWSHRMYQPQRMRERERQCTYNVILRRVHESLLPWRSNKYYLLVCVCVRACMWIPGCVAVCMHVALLIQHATRMRHIVTSFVAARSPPHLLTLSHEWRGFREKVTECKMCVLIFSISFV